MARYYRKKRIYKRSKGRWSANIKTFSRTNVVAPANSTFFGNSLLCENPAQTDNTVSQQYTAKNIELSFEMEQTNADRQRVIEGLTAYIMYIPQGYTITETLPNTHPEWIMSYRFLGSPNEEVAVSENTGPYRNPLRIKTRMARRLQTGDSIQLIIVGTNPSGNSVTIEFSGIIRWWTKAN